MHFQQQWREYGDVQAHRFPREDLDRVTGLLGTSDLRRRTVLEVGAGGGRHTRILVSLGAEVLGMDLFALGSRPFVKADGCAMPFRAAFDLVFVAGVVQHTPDPLRCLQEAWGCVRPGGALCFDVYERTKYGIPRGFWRGLASRLPYAQLRALCAVWAEVSIRIDQRLPGALREAFRFLFPVYRRPGPDEAAHVTLELVDTLGAEHEHPMTPAEVIAFCASVSGDWDVWRGPNGLCVRMRKVPLTAPPLQMVASARPRQAPAAVAGGP